MINVCVALEEWGFAHIYMNLVIVFSFFFFLLKKYEMNLISYVIYRLEARLMFWKRDGQNQRTRNLIRTPTKFYSYAIRQSWNGPYVMKFPYFVWHPQTHIYCLARDMNINRIIVWPLLWTWVCKIRLS